MKTINLVASVVLLASCLIPTNIQAIQTVEKQNVVVLFKDKESMNKLVFSSSDSVQAKFESIPAVSMNISMSSIEQLKNNPNVLAVELEQKAELFEVTEEPKVELHAQTTSWGLNRIKIKENSTAKVTGKGVKVCVIDTGIDYNHQDLNVVGGKSFVNDTKPDGSPDNTYMDYYGHGTHVAGIIAAKDNSLGVLGVAPDVELYAAKIFDRYGNGGGTTASIQAIDWCMQNDMDVVNMSYGFYGYSEIIDRILYEAEKKGMLLVASAGNGRGVEPVAFPAISPSVIAVSGTDGDNLLGYYSSIGKEVEVAAPGTAIYSSLPNNTYGNKNGTSMASPHVVGALALYKEMYPEASAQQLRRLLTKNVKDLGDPGRDKKFGYGLIQIDTTVIEELPEIKSEVIAVFKDKNVIDEVVSRHNGEIVKKFEYFPAATMKINSSDLERLMQEDVVVSTENNKGSFVLLSENLKESEQTAQLHAQTTNWGVNRVKLNVDPNKPINGTGVKIAIIDSGVDYNHPDLKIAGGVSFVGDNDYKDEYNHGTAVAGIIGAQDNDIGTLGIVPEADIYALKVSDAYGRTDISKITQAIEWSITNDIDIINLSIGSNEPSETLRTILDIAYEKGILIVGAAGNDRQQSASGIDYPGRYDSVIAVGFLYDTNKEVYLSSIGPELEITAPGVGINVPMMNNAYNAYGYGSSIAAAHVTGTLAMLKELHPTATNKQLRKILQETTLDLGVEGRDEIFGYGLVQVDTQKVFDVIPPLEVTNVSKTPNVNSVSLSWKNPVDEDFSHVKILKDSVEIANNITDETFDDVDLQPETTYNYKIITVDKNGNESLGIDVVVTTLPKPDLTPPSEVSNVSQKIGINKVGLFWKNPIDEDFSHIKIFRDSIEIANNIKSEFFVNENLKPNTDYEYKIVTVDVNGNESSGQVLKIKTLKELDTTPPSEVSDLSEIHHVHSIKLSWKNPIDKDFSHVKVLRGSNVIAKNLKTETIRDDNLYANKKYNYTIIAVDSSGNESKGKTISIATLPRPVTEKPFGDIEQKHWAKDAISELKDKNIIGGYQDGSFKPDNKVTRGEFAALVVRSLNLEESKQNYRHFEDVKEKDWYYGVVQTVTKEGLMVGVNEKEFAPNKEMTREEIIVIVQRVLERKGLDLSITEEEEQKILSNYKDKDTISSWAKNAMAKGIQQNLITGTSEIELSPRNKTNRAESAAFILRFLEKTHE